MFLLAYSFYFNHNFDDCTYLVEATPCHEFYS